MKYFAIFLVLIGFVGLTPFNAFAHEVTELYGVGGCTVNSCGMTDWDSLKVVSNGMFYVSLIAYSVITVLILYSLHKRNLWSLKL